MEAAAGARRVEGGLLLDKIAVLDMVGYRMPTPQECGSIERYVLKKKKKESRMYGFWNAFFAVVCACGLGGTITAIGTEPAKVVILDVVIVVAAAAAVAGCRVASRHNKQLAECMRQHSFKVMDCRAYEVDFGGGESPGAAVMVYNASGQYCRERMLVDSQTCREWEVNKNVPFLLVRCDYAANKSYWELFTARKLAQ